MFPINNKVEDVWILWWDCGEVRHCADVDRCQHKYSGDTKLYLYDVQLISEEAKTFEYNKDDVYLR